MTRSKKSSLPNNSPSSDFGASETLTPEDAPTVSIAEDGPDAQIAALGAKRDELSQSLEAVNAERDNLRRRADSLTREIDQLTVQLEALAPKQKTTHAILAYIHKQQEIRVARAERLNALMQAGVDASELISTVAPIDAAMASRRRRGTARPQYPRMA